MGRPWRGTTGLAPSGVLGAPVVILTAVLVGLLSTTSPLLAVTLAGVLCAVLAPRLTIAVATAWIVLCRVGDELVTVEVAGAALSEVDALVVLASISGIVLRLERGRPQHHGSLGLFMLWPAWFVLRTVLGPSAEGFIPVSPLVDLRLVAAFAIAPAVREAVLRCKDPRHALLTGICWLAYTASALAIVGRVLLELGVLTAGRYPFFLLGIEATQEVRPGGEVLIPVVLVLALRGDAVPILGRRWLPFVLLGAEIWLSQTLSLLVASIVGVAVAAGLAGRGTSVASRVAAVAVLVAGVALTTGTIDASGRFNLSERIGEDSASYRLYELEVIGERMRADPTAMFVGSGAGTVIQFQGIGEVKRDAHNVYASVAWKTGIIGLVLFVTPYVAAALRARRRGRLGGSILGGLAAVGMLSVSVPLVWTFSGLVGLSLLLVLTEFLDPPEVEAP